ncbi:MAG: T9SS type A sorting domain-containing protein [Saprospiraceae bacterium]|nr:T9SS type A sorting domain-containing protein [Saprospiraceae bacterium]
MSSIALSAQKWESLAPIPESFTFPVVAVANGKIHIMGGGGVGGATNKHYAYDPATNSWAAKANVPYMAQQPAGTSVNNKIHFFGGGFPNSGSPLNSHHVYDPLSDSWNAAANLTAPRAIHYAANLNEELYSLAGQGMTTLCQTYNAGTNSWTTKNPLPDGQFFYGAHVTSSNHIYRFCGGGYTAPHNRVHRYDAHNDSWTALTNFPARIHGFQGAAIGDQIFLAGGYYDFQERTEVYQFDTKAETVGQYPISLPIGVNYHNMVSLDSCIYVIGGNNAIDPNVKFQLLRLCPYKTTTKQSDEYSKIDFHAYMAGSILQLELPDLMLNQQTEVAIFNINGTPVFKNEFIAKAKNAIEINQLSLRNGMYLIQIKSKTTLGYSKIIHYLP